jgi:hypothetical protein
VILFGRDGLVEIEEIEISAQIPSPAKKASGVLSRKSFDTSETIT